MKRIHHKIKSDEQWRALRMDDITSTDMPALYGLSKYATPFEIWYRKKNKIVPEKLTSEFVKWGKRLERPIAKGWAEDNSAKIQTINTYIRIPEIMMGASFDFRISSGEYKEWLLEVKNVDRSEFYRAWDMESLQAPEYVEIQAQHQIEVAGAPGCMILALVGGNTIKAIPRKRNKKFGAALRKKCIEFWKSIDEDNAPSPDYSLDSKFIISMHQSAGEKMLEIAETEEIKKYISLKRVKVDVENELREIQAKMFESIGDDYNRVSMPGYSISCGMTKGSSGKLITKDMVGKRIGERKPYRQFRVKEVKNVQINEGSNDGPPQARLE